MVDVRRQQIIHMRPGGNSATGFSPGAIVGMTMTLWLDVLGGQNVFQNAARTTPAGELEPIGGVTDLSGAGNHFSQGTDANRLLYTSNLIYAEGGAPSAKLVAASVPLSSFIGAKYFTLFGVVYIGATPLTGGQLLADDNTASSVNFIDTSGATTLRAFFFNGNSSQSTATRTIAGDNVYIVCARRDSTAVYLSVNGGTEGASSSHGDNNLSDRSKNLGLPSRVSSNKTECGWANLMCWNSNMSLANRNLVGAYLASRFGISWTPQS